MASTLASVKVNLHESETSLVSLKCLGMKVHNIDWMLTVGEPIDCVVKELSLTGKEMRAGTYVL